MRGQQNTGPHQAGHRASAAPLRAGRSGLGLLRSLPVLAALLVLSAGAPRLAQALDTSETADTGALSAPWDALESNFAVELHAANLELTAALLADPSLSSVDRARAFTYHIAAIAGLRRWELFDTADAESAALLRQLNDPAVATPLAVMRAKAWERRGKREYAQELYEAGLEALPPEHPDERSLLLAGIGRTHLILGNYEASLRAFTEAERLRRTFGLPAESDVFRGLCSFYLIGGNWVTATEEERRRALHWCELDVEACTGRPKRRFGAINNLIVALRLADEVERADALIEKEYWSEAYQADPGFDLGANYIDVLDRRKQYETALAVLEDLRTLAAQVGGHRERVFALRRTGNMLDRLERHDEALRFYRKAYEEQLEHPDASEKFITLYGLLRAQIRVDEPPEKVLESFDTFYELYNEYHAEEARRRVEALQAEHDLERKELELDALTLSQEVQAKELDSAKAQQRSTRNLAALLLIGLLLLSLAVVQLVINLRLRKRTNQRLAEKNTEIESLNRELRRKSLEDPLTGLSNRRSLDERVNGFIETRGRRGRDAAGPREFVVFLIDLDHFKAINDGYGHAAGDAVLRQFAEVLRRCAREGDIQARWGGEEFCWLCPDLGFDDAHGVCQRLLKAVNEEPFEADGAPLRVTCSVGYATWLAQPSHNDSWAHAARVADLALYEAKASGRNRGVGLDVPWEPEADTSTEALRTRLLAGDFRRNVVSP